MVVTIEQIKQLREQTGAGVMDSRKALEQAGGDFDKALELLREKGMALAAKLGFLEEYRSSKWRPGKGKRGKKAMSIIEAFHNRPQKKVVRGNTLKHLGPPPANMPQEIRRLIMKHLLKEKERQSA